MLFAVVLIAFLKGGEVWTVPPSGGPPTRVTRTGGRVEDFRYSPTGEYLAYSKRIRRSVERPVASIVILRVATGDTLVELKPDDGWIDIDRWVGTKLIYHSSAAMEVSGVFEFDAASVTRRELDADAGAIALDSDLSRDGSLLVYQDDAGVGPTFQHRLHLVDTSTGEDRVHLTKRSLMAPAVSPDDSAVVFVEVFGDARDRDQARDRVWVYRVNGVERMIFEGPVRAKGGGSGLSWSTDGRRIAMNFGGRTDVFDAAAADTPTLVREYQGTDACWISAAQLLVSSQSGIESIDVDSGRRDLVVAGGARPQCLR